MNKAIIIGHVGNDPEVKHLESGSVVASFSVATSKTYKNKSGEKVQDTEWHNIVTWNKTAEIVEKYVKKGMKLALEGEIRSRNYEDKDGVKRYVTEIVCHSLEMLSSKDEQKPQRTTERKSESQNELSVNDEDDDLPF